MENFEYIDIWWAPEEPDNQISGTLSFNSVGEVFLYLNGSFKKVENIFDSDIYIKNIINGTTQKGIEFILYKCYEVSSNLSAPGQFELFLYEHFPYFHAVCIDGNKECGKMFISPYIFKTKRAEMPGFLISKSKHPIMFEKYWLSIKELLESSIQI